MKLKKKRDQLYTKEEREAKQKSMGIKVYISPEGHMYKSEEHYVHAMNQRMENRITWQLKNGYIE